MVIISVALDFNFIPSVFIPRYETNIICPPLYAGTYHVTPFGDRDMDGGSFMANVAGLAHYSRFGYKGKH